MQDNLENNLTLIRNCWYKRCDGEMTDKQMGEYLIKAGIDEQMVVTWLDGHNNGVVRGALEVCKKVGIKADMEELTKFDLGDGKFKTMGMVEETPPGIN